MKLLSLLMWVGQFGFSILFPLCLGLGGAAWLHQKYDLGYWIFAAGGILGLLTSISTAKSCLHSLRKAAEEASGEKHRPISFNDHQ